MNSFFILGQVPGTGLVITFWMWVELAALVFMLAIWFAYRNRRAIRNYAAPTISNEPGSFATAPAR